MKKRLIIIVGLLLVLTVTGFSGCARKKEAAVKQTLEVVRGDLVVTVNADGSLDMPHESKLRFGTPGTVKGIYVKEGDRVREGALLAKLDDTTQKLAVQQAQYNVELAMNELVEKIHPALMGYPKTYPDPAALQRLEQARDELIKAKRLLEQQ
ncbi:MAG: biotin/lipoyl-binding protein, partial [Chloroflexi bacterium]|nr:biotin/lipoyl-binding protein [Chloroflexota bacterium]